MKLTDYSSRNPISKPRPIESYDEEFVINCIIPLLEFINNHGSITDERETTTRTNQMNSHKTNNQSKPRYVLKLQTSNNQQKNRSSLLSQQNSVYTHHDKSKQIQNDKMDLKIVEAIEKEDPSEETLKLTTPWKEITKPGHYCYTQGQWKRYNPPRTLKAEQKKIEIELWQKKNKLLWRRMEGMSQETQEEIERKREFHRVIDKIRNLQKPNETGQRTSRLQTHSEIPKPEDAETMSSGSENTIAVPAINFKRYLGATGVRYINMGKASKIQTNSDWDLEETVRQVEQKFATDLKTIAGETTNDEKLLKTLVCIERKTMEQIPEEYKDTQNTYQRDSVSSSTMTK